MQFTTFAYMGFFAAVFAVYWAAPARRRWAAALAASVGFYALFGAPMLAVLALCIAATYAGGLWLEKRRGQKRALALCVGAALLPLLFFKYFHALLGAYAPAAVSAFSLMMPVGLSFFTFKTVAYLAEVYKGALDACRSPGRYALYVSIFPQVSMGPIQRPGDLLAQIAAPHGFDSRQALSGAQLLLWGYFEKLVVAENLANYSAVAPDKMNQVIGCSVFLTTVFYAVRLYADFAGYSHIAIGCMQLLGFSVPENFRAGILESLAYFALLLAAGLYLYPARRKPLRRCAHRLQSAAHVFCQRPVARRGAAVYCVGAAARLLSGGWAIHRAAARAAVAARAHRARKPAGARRAHSCNAAACLGGLGVLFRRESCARMEHIRAHGGRFSVFAANAEKRPCDAGAQLDPAAAHRVCRGAVSGRGFCRAPGGRCRLAAGPEKMAAAAAVLFCACVGAVQRALPRNRPDLFSVLSGMPEKLRRGAAGGRGGKVSL